MHQLNEVEDIEDCISSKPIRFSSQVDNKSTSNLNTETYTFSRSGSKNMTAGQKSTRYKLESCSIRLHTCIHTLRRNICPSSISVYEP